jgi:hypothetical protein
VKNPSSQTLQFFNYSRYLFLAWARDYLFSIQAIFSAPTVIMGAMTSSLPNSKSFASCYYQVNTEPWTTIQSPGRLCVLIEDVLLHLLSSAPITTTIALSKTCRFFYLLSKDDSIWRTHAKRRFNLLPNVLTDSSYRDLYIRLDSCSTCFNGFAIDRATNEFLPYPMEILIAETSFSGNPKKGALKLMDARCRWPTLRDSLTRVEGFVGETTEGFCDRFSRNQFLGSSNPRIFKFKETELLRGEVSLFFHITLRMSQFQISMLPLFAVH